mmetsp:Transcript_510/g.507  ORF Transcript_510/g.507 Transcript_510/m.507 type:complete len:84 (-) Transcript_510:47-298(-)|eukprot:CAMPEP_0197001004 /NCGR_PEP_ID=MMETSP1380-20130617/5803_1 /TAXON_ID=5936 /ORGANISM="Euplotes crassus, Strain CT5" /LENGTH=83 /DNA_ID=CAMNT_0042418503 /DNA_START=230 /DNA_END=481 /DNA_ORIENTATION=+
MNDDYVLLLKKCSTQKEAIAEGQKGGRRLGDNPNMSIEYSFPVTDGLTIGDIHNFMLYSCDDKYDLITNNCQKFAKDFVKWAK